MPEDAIDRYSHDLMFGLGWSSGVVALMAVVFFAHGTLLWILPALASVFIVAMYVTGYRSLHTNTDRSGEEVTDGE